MPPVLDDGGTDNSGDDSIEISFDVEVTAVNDEPLINVISDPGSILEDAAEQTINLEGIAVGGNDFVWEATDRILHYGTVTGDIDTMVDAFTKARDIGGSKFDVSAAYLINIHSCSEYDVNKFIDDCLISTNLKFLLLISSLDSFFSFS